MDDPVGYLTPDPAELDEIEALLDEVMHEQLVVPLDPFLRSATVVAHRLPERVRRHLYEFKLTETPLAVCIHGRAPDGRALGPTPCSLAPPHLTEVARREDVLFLLYGALLGEPFTWTTIQNGYIINDIIPIRAHADAPMSSGSAVNFDLHTEDAFHSCAGDYLGLLCLRNDEAVPLLISALADGDLSSEHRRILQEPRFLIGANPAHRVRSTTQRVPILFGNAEAPYLRLNLNAMGSTEDSDANSALAALIDALRANAIEVNLRPGDHLFLDNFRAVHGRPKYVPRYDNNARWWRRLYITADLRRSRSLRATAESRIIQPMESIEQCRHGREGSV